MEEKKKMLKKKTIIIMALIITTILLCTTITAATDNTTTPPEKISTTNTHTTPTTTKQETTTQKEIKKINKENKTTKKDSYTVTVNPKTVTPGTTTLTATVKNNNYYSTVNSGTMYFYINNKYIGSSRPSYGLASLTYNFKNEGTYYYNTLYYYNGYSYNSNTAKITVKKDNKYPASLSMNSDTILQGTQLNYPILVVNSSKKAINEGTITFYIDDAYKTQQSVYNGKVNINIGTLSAGTHKLKATFTSNNYKTTTLTKTLTVKSNQVNIDINTTNNIKTTENMIIKTKIKSLDGEPVGNNGYITLYLNNKYVKKEKVTYAQATFNLGKQKEGTYTIKTIYERPQFVTKTQTKTITVYNVPEIVKLDTPSKISYDSRIKLVARVTKDGKRVNGGKLKITANWKTIYENPNIQQGLGAVYYKTPGNPGTYTIVAQYLKNGKLITQDKKTITIPAPQIKLSMPTESETDTNIKIIARVSQDGKTVNTGQIKIIANGKTIYNKNNNQGIGAVFYKTPGKAGNYTITTQFINNGKTISQDTQTLKIINTESITYEISGSWTPNEQVTLTAYVSKPSGTVNNGNVRFKFAGRTIGTKAVKNGIASINYKLPNYSIDTDSTAEYIKNGEIITKDSQRVVTEYAYLTTINAPTTVKNGNTATIKAEVIDIFDDPINSGKVSFSIDNQWIGTTNVKNNIATLTYKVNKNPGTYTLKATYIDKNNNKASDTDTQSIKIEKNDGIITVTLPIYTYKDTHKNLGADNMWVHYQTYYAQYDPGAYVEITGNDRSPSTYRLVEATFFYENDYNGDIITRTVKPTVPYEYGGLSSDYISGYTPYQIKVSYRKMTKSEKNSLYW